MSPELINKKIVCHKLDIWALGGCIIEMLTGKPPYSDEYNEKTVIDAIAEGKLPKYPEVSDSLREFLDQIFQVEVYLRPTASTLIESKFINGKIKNFYKFLKNLRLLVTF